MKVQILMRDAAGGAWASPEVQHYPNEKHLQTIISESPELLPKGEGLIIAREVSVPPSGYIDLVGVSPLGEVSLVECKLRSNPESRRHIVGQLVSYAAAIWNMSASDFTAAVEARLGGRELKALLEESARKAGVDWDPDDFDRQLSTTLSKGSFRLLIVVDEITEDLKVIVEYLSGQMRADFLALELGYVSDKDVEILIPQTYGDEIVHQKEPSAKRTWTESDLFEALQEQCSAAGFEAFRYLYDTARQEGADLYMGGGATYPSVNVWYPLREKSTWVWSCYACPRPQFTNGPSIDISFVAIKDAVPKEDLVRFVQDLKEIPGAAERFWELEERDYNRRPSLPIDPIVEQEGAAFAIQKAIDRLRSGSGTAADPQ